MPEWVRIEFPLALTAALGSFGLGLLLGRGWGRPAARAPGLRHAVLVTLKPGTPRELVRRLAEQFEAMCRGLPGVLDYECGMNNSEEGLDQGISMCNLLCFRDEAARAEYLPHPTHVQFAAELTKHMACPPLVLDYWPDLASYSRH